MRTNQPATAIGCPLDRGKLRAAIEDAFTELALHPSRDFHFISGPALATRLGYQSETVEGLPPEALASFSGVGNPWRMGPARKGEVVLDIGCGAGTDTLIAARQVGPTGEVIGVDMTPAMVERAQQCVLAAGVSNVRVEWGHAESLPIPDDTIDLVISNGVISLTPSKRDTFAELARVLKPHGRLQIADVVVGQVLPPHVTEEIHLWTECIAGATWVEDYPVLLAEAGFSAVEIVEIFDVFSGTQIEGQSSRFATRGANIQALLRGSPLSAGTAPPRDVSRGPVGTG
jgi:arsenite methyltransferase